MNKNALMWAVVLLLAVLLLIGSLLYISGQVCRFALWKRCFGEGKAAALYAALLVLAVLGTLWAIWGYADAVVCFLHVLAFWLLCNGVAWVIGRVSGTAPRNGVAGTAAICITVLWLSLGWYNAHHVRRTAYTLRDGDGEPFRIVGFSDSHVGALFSGRDMNAYVDRMNAESPDAVVIVGDFVDDESSWEDMAAACEALSRLKAKCGVFYVFGNHDSGYYSSRRGYGLEELTERLRANGVRVLEDETVRLRGDYYLCGRLDAQGERKSASELTEGHRDGYIIMLDHHPTDFAGEMSAGANLVLSGHTHGGQLIPIRRLIGRLGKNDRVYGHEKRGDTNFIVSSGIGDWAIDFKTGCISEYFVVDIVDNEAS